MTAQTNIYFDFEFIDDGREIVPISVGMCAVEPIEPYYAPAGFSFELYVEYEFDPARANDWVRAHVFPRLEQHGTQHGVGGGHPRRKVAEAIREWVAVVCGNTQPRFWGYYPSYDWVCLMQHFGTMTQAPKGWPMRPECLMQMADNLGVAREDFPADPTNAHNALADAKWNRDLYTHLLSCT